MERRNFIQKSAVGLVGYNLIGSGQVSSHLFQTSVVRDWLHQLVTVTAVSKRSGLFLPSGLSETIAHVTKTLSDKGFKGHRSPIYFYGEQESYCFFAIETHHEASAMTDIVLPVLHKRGNGQWEPIATINGYQLEALVHVTDALKDTSADFQTLLLPVTRPSNPGSYRSFTTLKGGLDIHTQTYLDKPTETMVSIYEGQKELFTNTYRSAHCLTSSVAEV